MTVSLEKSNTPIIFGGNSHPELVETITKYINLPKGKIEVYKFSNDNSFVKIKENIRGKDVFILQTTSQPVNDHILEMLIIIDACKRASAGRITAIIPYFSYARTDKKDQPRVPITARLIADLISTSGADRAVLFDLHAGQVQGFFSCPVDELTAMPLFVEYLNKQKQENLIIVAADIGISKRARDLALYLDAPLAIIEKRRLNNGEVATTYNIIGNVEGKKAILFDDEITTGGSMLAAIETLNKAGVKSVTPCVTHAVFTNNALGKLSKLEVVKEIIVTDTVPISTDNRKVKVLSVAELLGEAVLRINQNRSIGQLFEIQ